MKTLKSDIRFSTDHLIGVFSFLLLIAISAATNFPMFKSWFGIIDDHMVIEQLRPLDHISLLNLPHRLITDTEIGDFGNYPRYRPFYYLLKFILISVLGDLAGGYYIFRAFVQSLCCFLLFRVLSPVSSNHAISKWAQLPTVCAGLLISIGLLSLSSWTDITLRLGPSELELTFGVLLTCYALFHLLRLNTTGQFTLGNRNYLLLCLGVFIAVGAKENGLVTVVPLIIVTIFHYKSFVRGSIVNITALIFVVFQTLLVLSNTMIVIARGSDVYGTPRSLNIMLNSLWTNATDSRFAVLIIATGLLIPLCRRTSYLSFGRLSLALFLDFLFLSEGVFYVGSPNALRYQILSQVCVLVVPSLALIGLTEQFVDRTRISLTKISLAYILVCFGLFSYLSPVDNLKFANQVARSNLQLTSIWRSEFDELQSKISTLEDVPVIINVLNPDGDYERIFSLVQFFRYAGLYNAIYIKNWTEQDPNNELTSRLALFSEAGSNEWEINPLSSLSSAKKSFCVFFNIDVNQLELTISTFLNEGCTDSQVIVS
jgi:hypothetical protein